MSINESEMETVATHLDPGADDCFERLRQRGCRSVVSAEAVGADVGVSVDVPLRHGDLVAPGRHRLVVQSDPVAHGDGVVLELQRRDLSPNAAASKKKLGKTR